MSAPAAPHAVIAGIGVLGPGLPNWPTAARVLAGREPWARAPTVLPPAERLPAAERRRIGSLVRLTLAAGLEAAAHAGLDPATLPTVFTASGGDGDNCHAICETLASAQREISPTRFHNSVHNAAAGYWGIATGATAAANALCAHDASFGAGLLEALCQVAVERTPVLLIAYDAPYPEPLARVRPLAEPCAVALVLAPDDAAGSHGRIEAGLSDAPADRLDDAGLETLRVGTPVARSLPLLARLAEGGAGRVVLDYLDDVRLAVTVDRG